MLLHSGQKCSWRRAMMLRLVQEMNQMEHTITCYCGICTLNLVDDKATCHFQCGCHSCRQKIQFGEIKGGRKTTPLPELFLMPSRLHEAVGIEHMKAYKLREDASSTQVYCTKCWAILGVDHTGYHNKIFLNFPEFCNNTGDLSLPLVAYIWMEDYNDSIGPAPTEDVPLFESTRYEQEDKRAFSIPEIGNTFAEPDAPIKGYTFRSVVESLEEPMILGVQEQDNIFEIF